MTWTYDDDVWTLVDRQSGEVFAQLRKLGHGRYAYRLASWEIELVLTGSLAYCKQFTEEVTSPIASWIA